MGPKTEENKYCLESKSEQFGGYVDRKTLKYSQKPGRRLLSSLVSAAQVSQATEGMFLTIQANVVSLLLTLAVFSR